MCQWQGGDGGVDSGESGGLLDGLGVGGGSPGFLSHGIGVHSGKPQTRPSQDTRSTSRDQVEKLWVREGAIKDAKVSWGGWESVEWDGRVLQIVKPHRVGVHPQPRNTGNI